MITDGHTPVIDFLAAASTHGGVSAERIETHASIVFLAGARAYKLKRAVRFDDLDFSTSERRRAMCEAELRLNRSGMRVQEIAVTVLQTLRASATGFPKQRL